MSTPPQDDRPLLEVHRGRFARRDGPEGAAGTEALPKRGWDTVFRVLTILLGVALGLGALGWPSLIAPWFATGPQVIHRVHNLGYGALVGVLLATPLVLQARRPETKPAAMQQALLVSMAMVAAEIIALDLDPFVPSILVLVGVVAVVHPRRRDLLGLDVRPSAALA